MLNEKDRRLFRVKTNLEHVVEQIDKKATGKIDISTVAEAFIKDDDKFLQVLSISPYMNNSLSSQSYLIAEFDYKDNFRQLSKYREISQSEYYDLVTSPDTLSVEIKHLSHFRYMGIRVTLHTYQDGLLIFEAERNIPDSVNLRVVLEKLLEVGSQYIEDISDRYVEEIVTRCDIKDSFKELLKISA